MIPSAQAGRVTGEPHGERRSFGLARGQVFNRVVLLVALASAAGALQASSASGAEGLVGVTSEQQLIVLHSDSPSSVRYSVPLRGLANGDAVLALARRPASGAVYGIVRSGALVRIDAVSGVVTRVGGSTLPSQPPTGEVGLAIDQTDRGFVLTSAGEAYRVDLDTGATTRETAPRFATTSPQTGDTQVRAAALTAALQGTAAYELDLGRNGVLSVIDGGQAREIGPLGFDFAVTATAKAPLTTASDGSLLAAVGAQPLMPRGNTELLQALFAVDPATGTARPSATRNVLGLPVTAMTAVGPVADDHIRPQVSVSLSSTQLTSRLLDKGLQPSVVCLEGCTVKVVARSAGLPATRSVTTALQPALGDGQKVLTMPLRQKVRARLRRHPNSLLKVEFRFTDGAGNITTQNRLTRGQTLRQRRG